MKILLFWLPLALQWLIMGLESPFLAAVIARLGEPTWNLAAYGVAYAFAILVESPVIMLMSAATALVEDAHSYRKLRSFSWLLIALSTGLLLLVLTPPVFHLLMARVLGLPAPVVELVHGSLWLLLPWTAAIGYRRLLHGVLIRAGQTRRVAYGTGLRLLAMAGTALALATLTELPGALVGAAALSAGVIVEALAARWMAADAVRAVLADEPLAPAAARSEPETGAEAGAGSEEVAASETAAGTVRNRSGSVSASVSDAPLDWGSIAHFYYPLALTSLIGLSVQPLLTFFMGRAPSPVESLAVFPVVLALSFLFRTFGLSFQEAAIALLGADCENLPAVGRFAAGLALATSAALALVAFTPLAGVWFVTVSGLPPELARLALVPARIIVVLPGLSVLLSLQRAVLVQRRTTRPITAATVLEVITIALLFPLFGFGLEMVGVSAAMLAFVGGRTVAVGYLVWQARRER